MEAVARTPDPAEPEPPRRCRLDPSLDIPAAYLWLRPLALLSGAAADAARVEDRALALAGSATAFTMVEALGRRPSGEVVAALGSIAELRRWAAERGAGMAARVARQLERLAAPRAPWAGLSLDRPLIMGIVNATPDSFSDGGEFLAPSRAIAHGRALAAAGADILDVGGESTRPGATPVAPEEELLRVEPVVRALAGDGFVVSIDTRHARTMAAATAAGARIINDVSALAGDGESLAVAARSGAAIALMHMQGEPQTMQADPRYSLASLDVVEHLDARIGACAAAGIERSRLVVDPGIGFGKRSAHNLELMARLGIAARAGLRRAARHLAQIAHRGTAQGRAQGAHARLARRRAAGAGARRADPARARRRRDAPGGRHLARRRRRGLAMALRALLAAILVTAALPAGPAAAADLSVAEVRAALEHATPSLPANLSGKDLRELDLSGLDFSHANLAHADLFGAKLVGANLSGADLRSARLDLAWIMRADFTGANLSGASMFGPVVAPTMAQPPASELPRFAGADFSGARVIARLAGCDLRQARFAGAQLGVDLKNQPMGQMRNDFSGADLSGADFSGADLNRAELAFANLAGANLTGANLLRADLAHADLRGAELTGADLTEADLDGAILTGAKDLAATKGLDHAVNAEKAVR